MTVIPFRPPRRVYSIADEDILETYLTRERAEEVMRQDALGSDEWRHIEERFVSEEEYSEPLAEETDCEFRFKDGAA